MHARVKCWLICILRKISLKVQIDWSYLYQQKIWYSRIGIRQNSRYKKLNLSFCLFYLIIVVAAGNSKAAAGSRVTSSSGTTATICLIRNGVELTVGHVGDSRAILCRNNTARRLTTDHLPSVMSEAERIVKCKGHLTWSSLGRSRVNGRLEMTRSLGDIELKPYGVIADPEVKSLQVRLIANFIQF